MTELKLAKLPDRVPVKISISVPPDLNRALMEYAAVYRAIHSEDETVAELIPFMLRAFLESDHGFKKARQEIGCDGLTREPSSQERRKRSAANGSNVGKEA